MNENEIFVSYAWKGASETLVDQLCAVFAAKDYTITRDKNAMTYKDSIREFMDRIGRGKFIIAVVNDKYMKSEYCMYEAYRMFQSPAFRERVFPIVLPDTDIFSFSGQVAYLKHWQQAYNDLETQYKEIAHTSPTMVAPLTERLRDIEATTRFINDFMAAVGDMNVLTSDMHLEANFTQLIQAIEDRMEMDEAKEKKAMSEDKENKPTTIHTGGGVHIGGGVNTGGGDFVGRDKIVYGNEIRGERAQELTAAFAKLQKALDDKPNTPEKMIASQAVKGLEEEAKKGSQASEENTQKWLQFLMTTLPDVGQVALDTFIHPIKGLSTAFQKIAQKAKEEKEKAGK